MKEYIDFQKNILPVAIKIIVPAYILQTLWVMPWDALDYLTFKAVVYGVIYWVFSVVALRMACEWLLMSFNAFSKVLNKD